MDIFWWIFITNDVKSCKKFSEKAETANFGVFTTLTNMICQHFLLPVQRFLITAHVMYMWVSFCRTGKMSHEIHFFFNLFDLFFYVSSCFLFDDSKNILPCRQIYPAYALNPNHSTEAWFCHVFGTKTDWFEWTMLSYHIKIYWVETSDTLRETPRHLYAKV